MRVFHMLYCSLSTETAQVFLCVTTQRRQGYKNAFARASSCQSLPIPVLGVRVNLSIRTLYDSKGLEFDDVRSAWLYYGSGTDVTKVLLYNFFEDSAATPNQWRLVLNNVEQKGHEAPAFDETRHASICSEASCVLSQTFESLTVIPRRTVEIPIRCNYSGEEKPLDSR